MGESGQHLANQSRLMLELLNRRGFEQRLEQAVIPKQTITYICYLDLDQFKIVNDTCGHLAGDELLRQVGTLAKTEHIGPIFLAHFSGDEFSVLIYLRKTDILARLGSDDLASYQCPLEPAVRLPICCEAEFINTAFVLGKTKRFLSVSVSA